MKKVLFLLLFLFVSLKLFSAPLEFVPVSVTQPDGVVLNIFASGDEFYNWLHDKDSYTIVQDSKTGYYVYASLENNKIVPTHFIVGRINPAYTGILPGVSLSADEILKIRNSFYANTPKDFSDAPKKGKINNLVIFIRFSDESEFTDSISFYKSIYNNDIAGKNSMYNYFKEVSYNTLNVTSYFYPVPPGTTVISYRDSLPRNCYKPYDSISNPKGYTNWALTEHTLLKNAVNYVASQISDTLNLDGDNDGNVDNVCFVIDGGTTAWNTLLWPHKWSLYTYSVYLYGKRVYSYNLQLQTYLKSSGVGVLCHEMTHSLGVPDLYHYTNNGISPCYTWDLMCSNTNPPQHIGAHMKYKYTTWIDSMPIISTPGIYTLYPITSPKNNCYRINSPYSSTEYFVVEFRRKALPFENKIPGSGLLLYRISTLATGNSNGPPDEVYIYRPNGTLTANGTPSEAHYSNLVGRSTTSSTIKNFPFLSDGTRGGLSLYNITSYDTVIKFSYGTILGIREVNSIANEYKLMQNYPNPFNPSTNINFRIKEAGLVTLKVYDILGKEVATLVNEKLNSGTYEIPFSDNSISSGIYFYRLEAGSFTDIKKMMLVK